MSDRARARLPISSRREGRRGTTTSRARPSRTRTAARASRRSGRTIVRARNNDSSTETSVTTSSTMLSRNRSIRTVCVMSRALIVLMTTRLPGSGAATVMTGVRSGARQMLPDTLLCAAATETSGHSRPSPRSRYKGGRTAPTIVSIAASRKRATLWFHACLSGSSSTALRTPRSRLSAIVRPPPSKIRSRAPVSRASRVIRSSRCSGPTIASDSAISRPSRTYCATRASSSRLRYESR